MPAQAKTKPETFAEFRAPSRGDAWNDARIDRLTELWGAGDSANTIARKLTDETGYNFTRNGVVGKAHRLGLTGRPSPIRLPDDQVAARTIARRKQREQRKLLTDEEKRERRAAIVRKQTERARAKVAAKNKQPLPTLAKAKPGDNLERMNGGASAGKYTLSEVSTANTCRWPFGHLPKMTFCGADRNPHDPTDPYCWEHRQIASTPTARQAQEHR